MPLFQQLGQSVSATQTLTNFSTTVDQYSDLVSISVTSGKWIIYGQVEWYSNGATTSTTYVNTGISTTSGNSATGLTLGTTLASTTKRTGSDQRDWLSVTITPITVTSTTTYYLKCLCSGANTNLQAGGLLYAVRVA